MMDKCRAQRRLGWMVAVAMSLACGCEKARPPGAAGPSAGLGRAQAGRSHDHVQAEPEFFPSPEAAFEAFKTAADFGALEHVLAPEQRQRLWEWRIWLPRCAQADRDVDVLLGLLLGDDPGPAVPGRARWYRNAPVFAAPYMILRSITKSATVVELIVGPMSLRPEGPPAQEHKFQAVREGAGWRIVVPELFDATADLQGLRRYTLASEGAAGRGTQGGEVPDSARGEAVLCREAQTRPGAPWNPRGGSRDIRGGCNGSGC